jgi:hypothetical protein
MKHRRIPALAPAISTAFIMPLFMACAESTTTPEADELRPRGYIQETQLHKCFISEPDPYWYPYGGVGPEQCEVYEPPIEPVLDDRAVYSDEYTVAAAVDNRNQADIETLVAFEQQQGYQSLRAYLGSNEWTEQSAVAEGDSEAPTGSEGIAYANDGVVREDFAVADGILSVLNVRGEIQIGDSVYKLTRDNAYAVHVSNLAVLRQAVPTLSSPAPAYDPRIVQAPVETTVTSEPEEEVAYSRAGLGGPSLSIGFVTDNCRWQSGNRRMHGKSYITNALFYSEAGVKTDWERKKLLWWSNTWQSEPISATWTSYNLRRGQNGTVITPPSGGDSRPNGSHAKDVIATAWFKRILGTINGTHTSSLGQCYTRVSR